MSLSFAEFMLAHTAPSEAPLTAVAIGYWQDWQELRPIDGGVAFELRLRQLPLDGSLESLVLLDSLLDQVKPHLAKQLFELKMQLQQRNLLFFIAFYTGWVWAYQTYLTTPITTTTESASIIPATYWWTREQLMHAYPSLTSILNEDLGYSVGISLSTLVSVTPQPLMATNLGERVLFPLVTVLERLYPRRQNLLTTTAPHFGYLAASLPDSVIAMLARSQVLQQALPPSSQQAAVQSAAQQQNSLLESSVPVDVDTQSAIMPSTDPRMTSEPLATPKPLAKPKLLTLPASLLSDLDNPLMERKDWSANKHQQPLTQRAIVTHRTYVMPDFSQLSMHDAVNQVEQQPASLSQADLAQLDLDDLAHNVPPPHMANSLNSDLNSDPPAMLQNEPLSHEALSNQPLGGASQGSPPVTPTAMLQQKLHHRLTSRQAIAAAKAQAKQLAKEKAAREAREQAEADALRQAQIAEALANPHIHPSLLNQPKSIIDHVPPIADSFSELQQDLHSYLPTLAWPAWMTKAQQATYQQAIADLQPSSSTSNSQRHHAYAIITQVAEQQLPDAMLRQALYQLRGEPSLGVKQDTDAGLVLVKAAAGLQDCRAEKLLSKLYFSGELLPQDSDLAKHWLAEAAAHGHIEAQQLQQSFAMIQTLVEAQHDEASYLKKLRLGVAVLLVIALVVIVAVKV